MADAFAKYKTHKHHDTDIHHIDNVVSQLVHARSFSKAAGGDREDSVEIGSRV